MAVVQCKNMYLCVCVSPGQDSLITRHSNLLPRLLIEVSAEKPSALLGHVHHEHRYRENQKAGVIDDVHQKILRRLTHNYKFLS